MTIQKFRQNSEVSHTKTKRNGFLFLTALYRPYMVLWTIVIWWYTIWLWFWFHYLFQSPKKHFGIHRFNLLLRLSFVRLRATKIKPLPFCWERVCLKCYFLLVKPCITTLRGNRVNPRTSRRLLPTWERKPASYFIILQHCGWRKPDRAGGNPPFIPKTPDWSSVFV